jgi:hypothetical protein
MRIELWNSGSIADGFSDHLLLSHDIFRAQMRYHGGPGFTYLYETF